MVMPEQIDKSRVELLRTSELFRFIFCRRLEPKDLTVRTKPRKTRESLALVADRSLTGIKVAAALTPIVGRRGAPVAITVDNGGEFVSRAMDAWAYAHDVRLEFIRPGRPVENAFIESFNGRLRDECLNAHVFTSVREAQQVLDAWRHDYNHVRPHSALQDRTPVEMGALWVDSREPRESTAVRKDRTETEIAGRFVTISPY